MTERESLERRLESKLSVLAACRKTMAATIDEKRRRPHLRLSPQGMRIASIAIDIVQLAAELDGMVVGEEEERERREREDGT